MDHGAPVSWDDIAGLEFAKATIKEIVVWPMLRPYVAALGSSVDSFPVCNILWSFSANWSYIIS